VVEKITKNRLQRFGHVEQMKREAEKDQKSRLYLDTWREREAYGGRGRSGWTMSGKKT